MDRPGGMEVCGSGPLGSTGRQVAVTPSWIAITALATLLATGAALPVILLGALAPLIRSEVAASPLVWGWVLATYYGMSSLFSVYAGRLGQRLPLRLALPLGCAGSIVGLLGIALATEWWHIVAMLTIAGLGSALVHPAANLSLAKYVPRSALGPVFGLKQASVPFAAVLAGFSLPLIGLSLGWRAAFLIFAVGLAVVAVFAASIVPRRTPEEAAAVRVAPRAHFRAGGPIWLLAVGAGLAVSANTAVNAFFVESAVRIGISTGEAGVMFGTGSAVAIGGRLLWGVWLRGRDGVELLRYTSLVILTGAGGLILLASTADRYPLWLAAIVMFATVGAWNGIFELAIVDLYPHTPAAATGVAAMGMRAGGLLGPVSFGFVSLHTSIRLAWIVLAASCLLGAGMVLAGRALIIREGTHRMNEEDR